MTRHSRVAHHGGPIPREYATRDDAIRISDRTGVLPAANVAIACIVKRHGVAVGVGLLAAMLAGCGSSGGSHSAAGSTASSSGGNAAVCQRIKADAQSVARAAQGATTNKSKGVSELHTLASKLKSDEAGGSAQLRTGVNDLVTFLNATAKAVAHHNTSHLTALAGKARAGEQDIQAACPSLSSGGTSSTG